MNSTRVMLLAAALAVGLAGVATISAAQDDPLTVINKRRELMKDNGGKMKAMSDAIQAGNPDMAMIEKNAQGILDNLKVAPALFPAGTGMDAFPGKTGAKPEIWAMPDKFVEADKIAQDEAAKLVAIAHSGDAAALGAQLGALGKNGCGTCHTTFRQKLE